MGLSSVWLGGKSTIAVGTSNLDECISQYSTFSGVISGRLARPPRKTPLYPSPRQQTNIESLKIALHPPPFLARNEFLVTTVSMILAIQFITEIDDFQVGVIVLMPQVVNLDSKANLFSLAVGADDIAVSWIVLFMYLKMWLVIPAPYCEYFLRI